MGDRKENSRIGELAVANGGAGEYRHWRNRIVLTHDEPRSFCPQTKNQNNNCPT